MRYAKLLGWPALLSLFMACATIAAEKPLASHRDARPVAANHRPAAIRAPHSLQVCDDAPPAPPPAEALPAFPSGADAIAALRNLGDVKADPKREWLLLVYLCGDSNLEDSARNDLKQMEIALPDSGVEVIALFDCNIKKLDGGYVNHPILCRVRKSKGPDQIDSEVLKDFGALDMADPQVLSAFIEGAVKAFPAREHALFAMNHGGGWSGLLYDDHAPGKRGTTNMDMPTFRAGMVGGMKAAGLEKWDILTFDMCLMGQLEVAAEIHDLADIMIASEELGYGFPYAPVVELLGKGTLGGRGIGADIVQEYEKYHADDGTRSTTLSAFDLSQFDDFNSKLNALLDKLIPIMPSSWSKMSKSLYYSEQYGEPGVGNGRTIRRSVDLLDTLKRCRLAMPDFPADAEYRELVKAKDRFVIARANSQRRQMSNGLAIYGPLIKTDYDPNYEKTRFFKISRWPALLQAVFAEQAKNTEPPKFGKIGLIDSENRPIDMMMPLNGSGISIEVEGKDLVWVKVYAGIHDPDLGGIRCFSEGYVTDRELVKKLNQGVEKFAQDVDLAMPQLTDGLNTLRNPKPGVMIKLSNGQTKVDAMIDCTDLSNAANFTIPVLIEHASYGDKPRKAILRADFKNFAVTSVVLLPEASDSTEPGKEIVPPADARILPQFWLTKDKDNTVSMVTKGALTWNDGLALTVSLLPAGDYNENLAASTMTGVEAYAAFNYKIVDNEFARHAPQTWKTFKSEMMVGMWQLKYSPIPAQEIDTKVTFYVWATDTPFVYRVAVTSIDAGGREKTTYAGMTFEIGDQPFYRLVFDAVGSNDSKVMIGAMSWMPRNDKGCILTHVFALEQNYVWLQMGVGAGPGPIPRDKPLPVGWHTVGDSKENLSLVVPPGFVSNEQFIQDSKKVFDGYDHASADENSKAALEIIRFDGVFDAGQVAKALVAGYKQKGADLTLGTPYNTDIDGVSTVCYSATISKDANDKNPMTVNLYLIPTPQGYVTVSYDCPSDTFEALAPTMWKIMGTARVAR